MPEKSYKVESFKAKQSGGEKRYRIIDVESGKVLDDAQGWGYRTPQKAHAAWAYLNRDEKEDARRIELWKWLCSQKELTAWMDDASWYSIKDNEPFTSEHVEHMLKELNIVTDYTPKEILKGWMRGKPKIGPRRK